MDFKVIISSICVAMTFIGYIPYFRDLFARKTTPHIFTWIVWTLTTGVLYALQVEGGAGVGSWIMLLLTGLCILIVILSIWYGTKDVRAQDVVFLILALIGLYLWIGINQPVLSAIVLITVDMLGFIPTIRKSWNNPHSETLSTYGISTVRHWLSILALEKLNILTLIFPITWGAANIIFTAILIARRAKLR